MTDPLEVAKILNEQGKVAVLPTDTIYGLIARAEDSRAVEKLYRLKDRHSKPGTLLALSIDQLVTLGLKRRYLIPLSQYWPGPLSVIIPTGNRKLDYLSQGLPDLAVRIPSYDWIAAILKHTGPLMSTSANLPGQPPATTLKQAQACFSSNVDGYFDGGDLSANLPSTIIKIIDDQIEVIRQGAFRIEGLEQF